MLLTHHLLTLWPCSIKDLDEAEEVEWKISTKSPGIYMLLMHPGTQVPFRACVCLALTLDVRQMPVCDRGPREWLRNWVPFPRTIGNRTCILSRRNACVLHLPPPPSLPLPSVCCVLCGA